MARGRTVLIALIALAVTMAPLAGAFAMAGANASESAAVSMQHDCCDQEDLPASKGMDDCHASAGCSFVCFNISGPLSAETILQPPLAAAEYLPASETFVSHGTAPPLPPPRV
jgi:hypothetical protein